MTQKEELEIYKKYENYFLKQYLLWILTETYGETYTDSLSDDTLNRIIDLFECWRDSDVPNNQTWVIDAVMEN